MQQIASTPLPAGSPTFAGLLATLTAPAQKHKRAWGDDDVEDDVVSLSYERALRAHARYISPELADRPFRQPTNAGSLRIYEAVEDMAIPEEMLSAEVRPAAQMAPPRFAHVSRQDNAVEVERYTSMASGRNLKSASITIRLSLAECLQLRQRAGEAGLTVSAYLRSCTFEAESLRALVKDTMAKLRSETSAGRQTVPARGGRTFRQRLAGLWPRSRAEERNGRA